MSTTRRRSYVSKPNFQIKLTIIFMLMVTIVANLVGGMCYWLISDKFYSLVEEAPDDFSEITTRDIAEFLIPRILAAQGVSLCFVFILSILVTHTIAGPVFRMERIAREIGRGNLRGDTRLRPRDELKELADAFNVMTDGLADKVRRLRNEVDKLKKKGDGRLDLGNVESILYEFQLPEDDRDVEASRDTDEGTASSGNVPTDIADEEIIEDTGADRTV